MAKVDEEAAQCIDQLNEEEINMKKTSNLKLKILTIIPARCGSKGIKNKNIIDVCGKPLIAYSIEPAKELLQLGYVEEVLVSTDCEDIANVAKEYGASVPFLRPKEISGDNAKSISFILHALEYYRNNRIVYDAVLLLQPTSPLRTTSLLVDAIERFSLAETSSLISVYREEYINDLVMYRKKKNREELEPLSKLHNAGVRRQDHGSVYVRNGSIYLTDVDYLLKEKKIINDTPLMIEMPKNQSINVDTAEDLLLLRSVLCK